MFLCQQLCDFEKVRQAFRCILGHLGAPGGLGTEAWESGDSAQGILGGPNLRLEAEEKVFWGD